MLKAIEDALPRLIDMRRELHAHPELSREEEWTSAFVAERLREIGMEVHTGIGGHGVVAAIHGGAPGPGIALRSDMPATRHGSGFGRTRGGLSQSEHLHPRKRRAAERCGSVDWSQALTSTLTFPLHTVASFPDSAICVTDRENLA